MEKAAAQVLHDDVDEVLTFKYIEQTNEVRVLAHLHDLYLAPLQLHIFILHCILVDDFDGDLFGGLLVVSSLHDSGPALSNLSFLDFIEVVNVAVTNCLFDGVHPLFLILLGLVIISPLDVAWEDQCK